MSGKPSITAEKKENGQVLVHLEGQGTELLELLIMVNRSIAATMLENRNAKAVIAEVLNTAALNGFIMAIQETEKGARK